MFRVVHYGIHVRLLIALPVLILGEGLVQAITMRLVPQFIASGVIPVREVPRFRKIVHGVVRLRDSVWPWLVIAVMVAGWIVAPQSGASLHELSWAAAAGQKNWGFGGWWYLHIARPVFQIFLLAWLWRIVLLTVLLSRTAGLGLQLAPLHPDHAGGLRFTEGFARMFAPFAFACSAVLAAHWAHAVTHHGAHVTSFRMLAIVFVVVMLLICLAPLAVFIPKLVRVRRRALLEYGALAGEHSRLVHRRWIAHEDVGEPPLLDAPELGPVADVGTLYEAVRRMRIVPIGKQALLSVALPVLVPLLMLSAIEIPIGELLGKIMKALL